MSQRLDSLICSRCVVLLLHTLKVANNSNFLSSLAAFRIDRSCRSAPVLTTTLVYRRGTIFCTISGPSLSQLKVAACAIPTLKRGFFTTFFPSVVILTFNAFFEKERISSPHTFSTLCVVLCVCPSQKKNTQKTKKNLPFVCVFFPLDPFSVIRLSLSLPPKKKLFCSVMHG